MAEDREVAQIRCMEVLARLSDYLDGDLEPHQRAQIEAHVMGCDWCERFGQQVGSVVAALKKNLAKTSAPDIRKNLWARLEQKE